MKKITILLSLLFAAAASAGDFGWLGGGGGVARIDTGSISTAHVMADTVSPFNESTVYIRNATFDTVTIRRIVHNQEIALFDSVLEVGRDGDTLRADLSIHGNVLEYEDENVTKFAVDSAGRVGIGTGTPIHSLSIVNSGGLSNALHIVNSTINKNRTTQAQSTDSASIWLGTLSTGQPMLRMRTAGGDSLSMWHDGAHGYIKSQKGYLQLDAVSGLGLRVNGVVRLYVWSNVLSPTTTDIFTIGESAKLFNAGYFSDNIYLGGKGQTATLTVGTQNTMTEQTDSCTVITPINGSGSVKLASAAGAIVTDMGVQPATYSATIGDMWLSRNGGTTPRDTLWIKVTADSSAYVVFGARELKH
jgi:hypothetical protein